MRGSEWTVGLFMAECKGWIHLFTPFSVVDRFSDHRNISSP